MMKTPVEVTAVMKRQWAPEPGATEVEIEELLAQIPIEWPSNYIALLRMSNGGEGELALDPQWFQLDKISLVIETWNDEYTRANYPNHVFFGGNGGVELIAFVISDMSAREVVAIDPVVGVESATVIAGDFDAFLESIGKRSEGDRSGA